PGSSRRGGRRGTPRRTGPRSRRRGRSAATRSSPRWRRAFRLPARRRWTRPSRPGCRSTSGSTTSPRASTGTSATCTSRTRASRRPTRTWCRGWRSTFGTPSMPMPTGQSTGGASSPSKGYAAVSHPGAGRGIPLGWQVRLAANCVRALWAACHRLMHVTQQETPPSSRGLFIALEGGDGAGKSTQGRLLHAWLEGLGHTVVMTREPGGTEFGRVVRELVLHGDHVAPRAEALLFAADRAHHVETL